MKQRREWKGKTGYWHLYRRGINRMWYLACGWLKILVFGKQKNLSESGFFLYLLFSILQASKWGVPGPGELMALLICIFQQALLHCSRLWWGGWCVPTGRIHGSFQGHSAPTNWCRPRLPKQLRLTHLFPSVSSWTWTALRPLCISQLRASQRGPTPLTCKGLALLPNNWLNG